MNARSHVSVIKSVWQITLVALFVSLVPTQASIAGTDQPVASVVTTQLFASMLTRTDVSAFGSLVTPDVLIHTPEGEFQGQQGLIDFAGIFRTAFSGMSFAAGTPTVDQDTVAVRWTLSGKHTGPYHGVAATCTDVSISGVAMLRIDGSRIAEQWMDYDRLAIVSQLEALSAIDTHSQGACTSTATIPDTTPEPTIPVCGPECDKPRGNR